MNSGSSSPNHLGMQRQGTHLYSLPSGRRHQHTNSASTTGSSINSRWSHSPEAPSMPLTSSSRSSLAESSSHGPSALGLDTNSSNSTQETQEWSLLSIVRVQGSTGMVLIALYHISTSTLYTWPLQTDPNAPQPKQGTVFVAPMQEDDGTQNDRVMSESLKMLTKVLLTWMRQGAARSKSKAKLGEREEDTDWLRRMLKMPKMDDNLTRAILDKQVVRPVQEWSRGHEGSGTTIDSAASSRSAKNHEKSAPPFRNKGKGVLGSLNTNVHGHHHDTDSAQSSASHYLTPPSGLDRVPSIEVSSPNTSEVRGRADIPWLQTKSPSFVR